ncbi:uncharacterized protein LOC134202559 [Armigeres subalbatus]|uniref:uncharacterized protein LOC134202559 n=1 Tax=Armigeres subalbatus TaxID=124917 RepID=UPI002ED487FF
MEQVYQQLQEQDARLIEIFHREEIDNIETFMELNDLDYKRLNMTTKMIKVVTKIQEQQRVTEETEEWIEEETPAQPSQIDHPRNINEPQIHVADPENLYAGINLEEIIDVNLIFERTANGIKVMEELNENPRPNDAIIKQVTKILCECLRSLFGWRPSNFYKNQISLSLVRTYPSLASKNEDVPQALWFHPHARGTNKHAGRIFYHMEYLARKSDERIVKRRRIEDPANQDVAPSTSENTEMDNIRELVLELKTIVPNQQAKGQVLKLWTSTFSFRQKYRDQENFYDFILDFPVFTAFDGELISCDFRKLKPEAETFADVWAPLEEKILQQHKECYCEIQSDFVRALAIVKPSTQFSRKKVKENLIK